MMEKRKGLRITVTKGGARVSAVFTDTQLRVSKTQPDIRFYIHRQGVFFIVLLFFIVLAFYSIRISEFPGSRKC